MEKEVAAACTKSSCNVPPQEEKWTLQPFMPSSSRARQTRRAVQRYSSAKEPAWPATASREKDKTSDQTSPIWDCGLKPAEYAKRMRGSGQWGGAIELAIFAHTNQLAVCVYEPNPGGGHKRISTFGSPSAPKTIHLLYGGRVHYDALEVPS